MYKFILQVYISNNLGYAQNDGEKGLCRNQKGACCHYQRSFPEMREGVQVDYEEINWKRYGSDTGTKRVWLGRKK